MLAKENGSISVTYWAVVNPDLTNCGSQTGNPGIRMHFFFLKGETVDVNSVCLNSQVRFCGCENVSFVFCPF